MSQQPAARPASKLDLFVTFTLLALQGFGGVLAVTQRELCERKRWLTHAQFVEILSIGQVLPGPNVVNVALIIGDRYFGWRGAFSALAGMMTLPLVIVLALTAMYVEFAQVPAVAGALRGMAAVAAGLIIGTALRLAASLRGTPIGGFAAVALAAASFVAVALLRWPLVWVLLGLGTLGMAWAWWRIASKERAAR
ncbi:MAG TPA: chromate transporter [Burkholderiaceae bacterium]|nr:chromate transporter [Burkholderiaceae bacterium]